MQLFGHPGSTSTRKALMVFAEKGIKPDFTLVDLAKGEHKMPEHLQRQPFGQVPVLQDGDFMLYESRAMIRYLDEALGTNLAPKDAKGRAAMEQWISIEMANFAPTAMKIISQNILNPMAGKPADQAIVEQARTELATPLDIMEAQLAKTKYISGDTFTLADIGYMPDIEYLFAAKCGDLIERRPHVAKWWKDISGRKSWHVVTGKAN